LTQIEIVLLALLYEKDCYGYEIESIIEERKMRNWTKIGFSSIYNSLNKLEKKGLVSSRYEYEYGSPERKVYFIKDDAKASVHEMIKKIFHSPERVYSEFSIGMAFSHLLTKEEVCESLMEYRESLEKRRQNILQSYSEQPMVQNLIHLKALFTHPLKLIEAEIEWINDLVNEIKEDKYDY
jgi:PadR family transcriptional regulator, regulatory protein PadR